MKRYGTNVAGDYLSKRVYDGVRSVSPEEQAHYKSAVDDAFAAMERSDQDHIPSRLEKVLKDNNLDQEPSDAAGAEARTKSALKRAE